MPCRRRRGLCDSPRFRNRRAIPNSGTRESCRIDQSRLIIRLRNYTGNGSTANLKNMPPVGRLSDNDYAALVNWVTSLNATQGPFTCNANLTLEQRTIESGARRLTRRQLVNTMQDLFQLAIPAATVQSLIASALSSTSLPADGSDIFSRYDSSIVNQHVRAYFDLSDAVATSVTASANLAGLLNGFINLDRGQCTAVNATNITSDCARQFIRNFGLRVLRRPLLQTSTFNELEAYLQTYSTAGGNQAGISAVVFRFLLAPNFLLQLENTETEVGSSLLRLASYSIANRLSYMFWNTMPDETLFALAANNDLSQDGAFLNALDYVASSAKAGDSIKEFANEWLKLSRIPQFAANNSALNYLANGITLDESLRQVMMRETEDLTEFVYRNDLTFTDLFTSDVSLARDPRLMSIYGVTQAAPAQSSLANAVRFPADQPRGGILNRAALLVNGDEIANPIHRGIKLKRDFLCLPLSPPAGLPADSFVVHPSPLHTTRETFDLKTSPSTCMGCHSGINPLGHALGAFNSLGKFQLLEPTFDNRQFSGQQLPIDTNVDLAAAVAPGLTATGALDLNRIVADQTGTRVCFSQKFMRFALGRPEVPEQESCRLNSLYNRLVNAQSLKDFAKSLANDPEFRYRKLGQ